MKKILLLMSVALCTHFAQAQKSVYTEQPNRLFSLGQEMFSDNNYIGATHMLEEFKKISKDSKMIEEADYLIVSSAFHRGENDVINRLKSYLDKYPATVHRNQLLFYIGSTHFAKKDWKESIFWLVQCDVDYLTISEQEDHTYRTAYAYLQTEDIRSAYQLFGLLKQNSKRYKEQSAYYMAYIDFQEGNFKRAIPIFRALKNNPTYKEKASVFLIQSEFIENNLSEVVREGEEYITNFPNTESTKEVFRLLGNSYFRRDLLDQSIDKYKSYIRMEPNPLRGDMYQLAQAYYSTGQYEGAIKTLKLVASSQNLLGQAGNMLLGQAYLKSGNKGQALIAFDAASRVNHSTRISEDALYNYVMLVSDGAISTFGESITALQNFLIKYPNSKYSSQVNNILSSALLSAKNYPYALSVIDKINTPSNSILEAKQIILYQYGVQEFMDGDYSAAKDLFDQVIALGTHSPKTVCESYFWRGDALYRLGKYTDAASDYTSYLKVAGETGENYALAFYNLGYTDFHQKDYVSALNNFQRYIAAEKDHKQTSYSDAQNRIGDCHLFNRNYHEAEQYYASAVNAAPESADYSEFQKAFVLGLQRNYAGKARALDQMMDKYPNSAYYDNALYEKSRALVMMNSEHAAISVLETLLNDYPKTTLAPQAGVQLGQLYHNVNKPHQAIDTYKKVIVAYPNTDEARTAIKSMEGIYKDLNDINSYASYLKSLGHSNALSANRQDSLTYLAAENIYMKERRAEAKSAFEKYLQSYPRGVFYSDANFYLGTMAFDAKDKKTALSRFKSVISSNNPKYLDDALIIASGIEFDNKDYSSAYNTYRHLSEVASTSENKYVGQLGMLRCAYLSKNDNEVVESADKLLKNQEQMSADIANEAQYYRGLSLRKLKRNNEAVLDLKKVAQQPRTAFGAEAQYILSEIYLEAQEYDKVESQVLSFMKAGTSHEKWMARAIIVLADAYIAKGDSFQAQQYLENLKANYKGSEKDIKSKVNSRLVQLQSTKVVE